MQTSRRNWRDNTNTRPGICGGVAIRALIAVALAALSGAAVAMPPEVSTATQIVIAAEKPGAPIDVEFIGNMSRLPALVDVSSSTDLKEKLSDKGYANALGVSIRARFPASERIRIGNLFFGYSCADLPFEEMAARDASGAITYRFDETLDMLELLVRAGTRPVLALTGTPRALIPSGEEPVSHPAYGCTNAPPLDLSKPTPRERAGEWWQLQTAFFRALRERFGDKEIASWEFATWTEPMNQDRKPAHLVLPKAIIDAGRHDEAVATILAASIDAAMAAGVRIHIGNFAGNIAKDYPSVIARIRNFPRGREYLDYIVGYAVSRYRTNIRHNIGQMMDSVFALRRNPQMPNKPLFIDELGQLVDDTGTMPPPVGSGLVEASFIATAVERVIESQDGSAGDPRRVALWNTAIPPRARDVVKRADAFVPSATMNLVNFFQQLNGKRKLTVSGAQHDVVAGRDADSVSLVLLGPHRGEANRVPGGPIPRPIKVTGLKGATSYVVTTHEVGRMHGNAMSAYVGGGSHLDDAGNHFRKDGNNWRFATPRAEQCFFDEIAECSWRSKGRQAAAPQEKVTSLTTNEAGTLELTLAPEPDGAILANIAQH